MSIYVTSEERRLICTTLAREAREQEECAVAPGGAGTSPAASFITGAAGVLLAKLDAAVAEALSPVELLGVDRRGPCAGRGSQLGPSDEAADVRRRRTKRTFSATEKLRILKKEDACRDSGERGALAGMLREEGINGSLLQKWRGRLADLGPSGLEQRTPTTRSGSVPGLHFRSPSAEAYAVLVAEAAALGVTPNQAAKLRAFPGCAVQSARRPQALDASGAGVEARLWRTKRAFSAAEKLRILKKADACRASGERGALAGMLREEGIKVSLLQKWRGRLAALGPAGLEPPAPFSVVARREL